MPTTLSLLGYRQITIIMTPLYDVYESLQHIINTAYNNDSRQQLVEQQIVIFEVTVDKKQSKAIYNTELTINDTVVNRRLRYGVTLQHTVLAERRRSDIPRRCKPSRVVLFGRIEQYGY
jgi:hypothetical protein